MKKSAKPNLCDQTFPYSQPFSKAGRLSSGDRNAQTNGPTANSLYNQQWITMAEHDVQHIGRHQSTSYHLSISYNHLMKTGQVNSLLLLCPRPKQPRGKISSSIGYVPDTQTIYFELTNPGEVPSIPYRVHLMTSSLSATWDNARVVSSVGCSFIVTFLPC